MKSEETFFLIVKTVWELAERYAYLCNRIKNTDMELHKYAQLIFY